MALLHTAFVAAKAFNCLYQKDPNLDAQVKIVAPGKAERLVCEKHVANLIAKIQEHLQAAGPDLERQLEAELYGLLRQMSAGEKEAYTTSNGSGQNDCRRHG